MLFHWTLDYCLKMNAMDFFTMLREGREVDGLRRADFLHDLTYVSAIPSLTENSARAVRSMFQERATSEEQRLEDQQFVEKVKSHTDSLRKPLEGEAARRAMFNVFALKRRSGYGR